MCMSCPDCNKDVLPHARREQKGLSSVACADCMGSNSKCMGGFVGIGPGLAFATEFQEDGTPHGHGIVSLANMYQRNNLEVIGDMLEHNVHNLPADQMLQRITNFVEHLHREDHFDHDGHERDIEKLEQEFHMNNAGPPRNTYLAVRPRFLFHPDVDASLWRDVKHEDLLRRVFEEGKEFRRKFETDVQFIFSRVQHHWHAKDTDGKRKPMQYCKQKSKGKKQTDCCKRGFPKAVLRTREGNLNMHKFRCRIVCRGVAAELDLKTTGRRNMLGTIVGRRRCAWFSGTAAVLAAVCRSNTN